MVTWGRRGSLCWVSSVKRKPLPLPCRHVLALVQLQHHLGGLAELDVDPLHEEAAQRVGAGRAARAQRHGDQHQDRRDESDPQRHPVGQGAQRGDHRRGCRIV
jgi:hypothetical protein